MLQNMLQSLAASFVAIKLAIRKLAILWQLDQSLVGLGEGVDA